MKVKKKKKEGKSSCERQAAKKPAYKPTLVYRSVGGQRNGTAAAGPCESAAHTEQGKAKAHGRAGIQDAHRVGRVQRH